MISTTTLEVDGQISVVLRKAPVSQNSFVRAKNSSAHRETGIMVRVKFKNQDLVVNSVFQKEAQKFVCNIENHSSDPIPGRDKVMFGNEIKINKLAPWSVNDLLSAMN